MENGVADRAALDAIQEELIAEMDAAVEFARQRAVSGSRASGPRTSMPET